MSFPTTSVLDNFGGADETPIATNWSGPVFNGEGQLRRLTNELIGQVAAGNSASYYDISQFGADLEVWAQLTAWANDGNHINLLAKIQNPGSATTLNLYFLRCIYNAAATDAITIRKITNAGASVQLADVSVDLAVGDLIGLEVLGTTITAYRKPAAGSWASLGNATDSAITGNGYIGVEASGNAPTMRLDAFAGGTVVTTPPPPGGATPAMLLMGVG